MCEQLGQVPDTAKMPLEPSAFPEEVQVAFFIFSLLSDRWEGMSGTYLGKNWSEFDTIVKAYDYPIEPKVILYFAKVYCRETMIFAIDFENLHSLCETPSVAITTFIHQSDVDLRSV